MAVDENIKDPDGGGGSFEPKPFGRYVLLDKLAVGGMAEIYKAKTYGVDGFEKLLAIKRILPHCAADKEFISMLIDEAKLTVLLSHANIVQVFDLGKVGDDYFISMEFINGTNLREVMNRLTQNGERLPNEVAVFVMSECCKGLDYAHRKTNTQGIPLNIVHRDISPQNILVSFEGEIKIVDFGIAKAAMNVSHTMAGILKGKIAYMSPEQALGKPIDHRTDIFSAGVVLYEMLTGEKLFNGETQFEILNKIRTTRLNVAMLPEQLPEALKGILCKALAYNAKDRYQSVADFQMDLTKHLYSSYIDFSPRRLGTLLQKMFAMEIARKSSIATIDDKTRSVLIKQAEQEDIMVHGSSQPRSALAQKTVVSGVYSLPGIKKLARVGVGVGLLGAAAIAGYLGYQAFKPEPKKEVVVKKRPVAVETQRIEPPPPSPAPAQEAVDLGSLRITTTPPGAQIFLNDADTGLTTPTSIQRIPLGKEYEVRIVKNQYKEFKKKFAPITTEPIIINEALAPLPLGIIDINSTPAGAKIFLNGRDTGKVTPGRIDNLEVPKDYEIKLSAQGHSEWFGGVQVRDLEPVRMNATLTGLPAIPQPVPQQLTQAPAKSAAAPTAPVSEKKKPVKEPEKPAATTSIGGKGVIKVDSTPSGADVFVNDEFKGTTPVIVSGVPAGSAKVLVSKPGYLRHSAAVDLKPGQTQTLGTIQLQGLFGEISINSTPAKANIYFDGNLIPPKTPVTINKVPRDRKHSLRIQLEGYENWETTVDMSSEANKKYSIDLQKK